MSRWNDILGKNARNNRYLRLNTKKGRQIADSKLKTKKVLRRYQLPVPDLIKTFSKPATITNFSWENLPESFVLKPSQGFGGGGILVIRRKGRWAGEWELMNGKIVDIAALRFHALEILGGRFSLHSSPDQAFIEERIKIVKAFSKYAYQGTPDIRVIVFNHVPVMAMLRLPTAESEGKANLHQGAIGVGIDLATGITTHGVYRNRPIKYVPGTKRKLNGLKIPYWEEILLYAVRTQEQIPSLGYLGIDFVISKSKGPLILELNARPGLSIQICNQAGLLKRLERVERLEIRNAEHGVRVAKALFGEKFTERVSVKETTPVLGIIEEVEIKNKEGKKVKVLAKIDSGASRSSIDEELAKNLGLFEKNKIVSFKKYKSSLGTHQERPLIPITFFLRGRKIETLVNVSNRSHLQTKFLVGVPDLRGFLIKP